MMGRPLDRFLRSLGLVVVLVVVLAAGSGCTGDVTDPAATFGVCDIDADYIDFFPLEERLGGVEHWLLLSTEPDTAEADSSQRGTRSRMSVMASEVSRSGVSDREAAYVIDVDRLAVDGISWALARGGDVFVATDRRTSPVEYSKFVLVRLKDGSHVFAGQCDLDALTSPLKAMLQDDFDVVLDQMVGSSEPFAMLPGLEAEPSASAAVVLPRP